MKLRAAMPPGFLLRAHSGRRPWAAWWSPWRAWGLAWWARRLDATAIRQLARCGPEVLDDIGAPPQWRAQVQAQRECGERWQAGLLDAGSVWPFRCAGPEPRRRAA